MGELFKRILVALVGIPVALLIIYYGSWYLATVVIIVSSFALWEYYKLAEKKGSYPIKFLGLSSNIILIITIFLYLVNSNLSWLWVVILIELYLIMIIVIFVELISIKRNPVFNIAITFSGLFYITSSMIAIIGIREIYFIASMLNAQLNQVSFAISYNTLFGAREHFGTYMLIIMFFSIWLCDALAYFVGKGIGKHKLYPRVSPDRKRVV